MYALPQEIEVWYIIPTIRRELAKILTKKYGLTLEKTGKILGVSKAAITQYLSKKRAAKVKLHPLAEKEILKSSERIYRGKSTALDEIMRVLKIIRKKKLHCELCGKRVERELHDCVQIVPKYSDVE